MTIHCYTQAYSEVVSLLYIRGCKSIYIHLYMYTKFLNYLLQCYWYDLVIDSFQVIVPYYLNSSSILANGSYVASVLLAFSGCLC